MHTIGRLLRELRVADNDDEACISPGFLDRFHEREHYGWTPWFANLYITSGKMADVVTCWRHMPKEQSINQLL